MSPKSYTNGVGGEDLTNRYPQSRIEVLIVGAGVGGLFLALECFRKGHKVQVIESRATNDPAG